MANTENNPVNESASIEVSIAPWISVSSCSKAVNFYKSAFGADDVYRLETPDGELIVARLSVKGAEFWLSEESTDNDNLNHGPSIKTSIRMILTVQIPILFLHRH
ncbi:MAG: hypothetical protein WDO19_01685 [Bacteroidota bacterium]